MTKYIKRFKSKVTRSDKQNKNGHRSAVFWATGLSGSGKSTIAHEVENRLHDMGMQVCVFDGDNIRHGLCGDLSFSPEARKENIRRIAETSKLFVENGIICLCAFIAPLQEDRDKVREILGEDLHEVYIKCSVETCEERDIKGYYKLARQGKIENYTGISAPYDIPVDPQLILETELDSIEESTQKLLSYVLSVISVT